MPVAIAAIGNQRTTYFARIEHYTPALLAAHRRRSLLTPAVRSSSNLDHTQASHPLHLPQLEPSARVRVEARAKFKSRFLRRNCSSRTRSSNIDIVTGSRITAGSPLLRDSPVALASIPVDSFSTLINRSVPFRRSLISTPGHHPRIPGNQPQHECRQTLRNPTVTNSTNRRISSQFTFHRSFNPSSTIHLVCVYRAIIIRVVYKVYFIAVG